jgi:hypothetical protein
VLPGGFVGYGHSGATQIFFTNLLVVPELRLGVFIAANTTTAWSLTQRFPKLLVEKFYAQRAASLHRPPDRRLAQDPSAYAGSYLTTRRPYAGLEKFIELFGGLARVDVSSNGYLLTDYGPFSKAWVPDGPAGRFRSAVGDEWLNFHLDATGRATDFLLPSGNATLQRVGFLYTRTPLDILTTLTLIIAAGVCIRAGLRGSRVSTASRAALLAVSAAWLLAFIVFVSWLPQSEDLRLMYDFPSWQLILASALASFATAGSILLLLRLPFSWRSEPIWARLLDATALLVFVTFGALIALWGGLLPWV